MKRSRRVFEEEALDQETNQPETIHRNKKQKTTGFFNNYVYPIFSPFINTFKMITSFFTQNDESNESQTQRKEVSLFDQIEIKYNDQLEENPIQPIGHIDDEIVNCQAQNQTEESTPFVRPKLVSPPQSRPVKPIEIPKFNISQAKTNEGLNESPSSIFSPQIDKLDENVKINVETRRDPKGNILAPPNAVSPRPKVGAFKFDPQDISKLNPLASERDLLDLSNLFKQMSPKTKSIGENLKQRQDMERENRYLALISSKDPHSQEPLGVEPDLNKNNTEMVSPSLIYSLNNFDYNETLIQQKLQEAESHIKSFYDQHQKMLFENKELKEKALSQKKENLKLRKLIDEQKYDKQVKSAYSEYSESEDDSALISPSGHGIITKEDEILIQQYLSGKSKHNTLTTDDLYRLNPGEWLNDEIINSYMDVLSAYAKEKQMNIHFFNSFFYEKLCSRGYSAVSRWTKKVDLFKCSKVMVPIHKGNHWCMAVINFDAKRFEFYDSMGGTDPKCLGKLREYLQNEYKDKKKGEIDLSDWNNYAPGYDVPQQRNTDDCGIFACKFANFVMLGEEFKFSQEDMPFFRKKMFLQLINNKLD